MYTYTLTYIGKKLTNNTLRYTKHGYIHGVTGYRVEAPAETKKHLSGKDIMYHNFTNSNNNLELLPIVTF